MTAEILKDEMLSEGQLDTVAGGTIWELYELADAMVKNSFLRGMTNVASLIPMTSGIVESYVIDALDKVGVNAKIDQGILTGKIFNDRNTYTEKCSGKSLTHEQVMERLRNYKG